MPLPAPAPTDKVEPFAEAVTVLADALDRLGGRIYRDLQLEGSEGAPVSDPEVAMMLAKFTSFADECLGALEDTRVLAALMAAKQVLAR